MFALLALLAYDREDLMVAALASLVVAGAVVTIGAWILLFKEGRRRHAVPGGAEAEQRAGEPADVAHDERPG